MTWNGERPFLWRRRSTEAMWPAKANHNASVAMQLLWRFDLLILLLLLPLLTSQCQTRCCGEFWFGTVMMVGGSTEECLFTVSEVVGWWRSWCSSWHKPIANYTAVLALHRASSLSFAALKSFFPPFYHQTIQPTDNPTNFVVLDKPENKTK